MIEDGIEKAESVFNPTSQTSSSQNDSKSGVITSLYDENVCDFGRASVLTTHKFRTAVVGNKFASSRKCRMKTGQFEEVL